MVFLFQPIARLHAILLSLVMLESEGWTQMLNSSPGVFVPADSKSVFSTSVGKKKACHRFFICIAIGR
jgi:hypothetical protein